MMVRKEIENAIKIGMGPVYDMIDRATRDDIVEAIADRWVEDQADVFNRGGEVAKIIYEWVERQADAHQEGGRLRAHE